MAKEVRLKCDADVINANSQVRGNVSLKHKNKYYDRKSSEVIKKLDSSKNVKDFFQDKHGGKWNLIDMEARERFTKSIESQIKCATRLNAHGERIKVIDKGNMHAVCTSYNAIEA